MSVPRPATWNLALNRDNPAGWSHTLRFRNSLDSSSVGTGDLDVASQLWDEERTSLLATVTVVETGGTDWELSLTQVQVEALPLACVGDILITRSDGKRRYVVELNCSIPLSMGNLDVFESGVFEAGVFTG